MLSDRFGSKKGMANGNSKIRSGLEGSAYIGSLPVGCRYCGPGQKMVLLITGKCARRCFYCPLSRAKRGKDVIYANELKVTRLEQIIEEANAISAKGTGITGGDPMVKPELTLEAIRLLKARFGEGHHIHLYTAGSFNPRHVTTLAHAGLDELRFHPPISAWTRPGPRFREVLGLAVGTGMDVGAELPVLPGYETAIVKFAKYLSAHGAQFLNLNELEFSETNWLRCKAKGYMQKTELSATVRGSAEGAMAILQKLAADDSVGINAHYCSAQFKDRQQLTNRLKRRAKNVILPYQILTDDGTFLLGMIEPEHAGNLIGLNDLMNELMDKYDVQQELVLLNRKLKRLELAPWVLKVLSPKFSTTLRQRCFIIEEYPTADRLEVERIPIEEFD